jgi:antitoxin component of MazEF toxin-antitoxin module
LPKKLLVNLGLQYGDFVDLVGDDQGLRIFPRKEKVQNLLNNLHRQIKIPPQLLHQDLDAAIAEAKSRRYSD